MENKTSHGTVHLEEPEYEISGQASRLTNSNPYLAPSLGNSAEDILLEDFPREDCFILNEAYVLMEEEYVMWEGTAPCKRRQDNLPDVFDEGALTLPEEDSLHHVSQYFTIRTTDPRKRHY